MKPIKSLALAILVVCFALPSIGHAAQKLDENLLNYLQLMRSEFNTTKVDVINQIMKLSVDDAKKFWPIYREYETELGQQAISRAELIFEFVKSHADNTLLNAKTSDLAKRWFTTQRARLDLLEKYHAKIEKAMSPIQAGQFLQIENQIGLFIDVAIASEMPMVSDQAK